MSTAEKFDALKTRLLELGSVAVAYSGGADSTFLLKTAHDLLEKRCLAVTVNSCLYPDREMDEAKEFCESEGITHIIIEIDPFEIEGFSANPADRCYLCKSVLMREIWETARKHGAEYVADGSNLDDKNDYRPGYKAVTESGAISPLLDAGLSKLEIRKLSKELGLPTWDKPTFACLASRLPYGEIISPQKLRMINAAEQLLMDLGFSQVRVRVHGDVARIEVHPNEFEDLVNRDNRSIIHASLIDMGFKFVAMDLAGYRTGSMNDTLHN